MQAFFKCCEVLSSLVRSDTHITPTNFPITVATIRRFTEIAASQGSLRYDETHPQSPKVGSKKDKTTPKSKTQKSEVVKTQATNSLTYATSSLRLLDLLDALYTRVLHVYDDQAVAKLHGMVARGNKETKSGQYAPESDREALKEEGGLLWQLAWRPLLQGEGKILKEH